jgi:hypothetical protein
MSIDYTLHVSDVIFGILTIIVVPLFKLLVSTVVDLRDQVRELNYKMGSQQPPLGVLGEIQKLKDDVLEHEKKLIQYRDWLIKIQDRRKKDDTA